MFNLSKIKEHRLLSESGETGAFKNYCMRKTSTRCG